MEAGLLGQSQITDDSNLNHMALSRFRPMSQRIDPLQSN
jgi:hypothetical protein